MKEPKPKQVIIGRIGAPFGVQGWQHIQSFTQPPENILDYPKWYVRQKEQWMLMEVKACRCHGKGFVAQLQGIEDRDMAALWVNADIAIERDQFAPLSPDEFYWADLEGLSVQTKQGERIGDIQYLYENAGTDIMVVKHQEKEQHIPFRMHDTVVKVDLANRQVIIDWDLLV
jgi:16S rRNA processing protein RimM